MASSWNNFVKLCYDYMPGMPNSSTNEMGHTPGITTIDEARRKQDAALKMLGLHRYKIPEDGNCMFRAVASQLKRDQDKHHPLLRQAASDWAADHIEELLANGLLDNIEEVQQMRSMGTWQGQAALVALANVLGVNIAVVQGGDKGAVDIQHITPYDKGPRENVVLAYLYNGHYDAASPRDDLPNPRYERWQEQCRRREEDSVRLVKRLTDGETHSTDISKQLAHRLDDEEDDSQQEASEILARRLTFEDDYFQQLHDERSSLSTSTSLCSSKDSANKNNGCTRTVTSTANWGTSHDRDTHQMAPRRKSPRLSRNVTDEKQSSSRSLIPSKHARAGAVAQTKTNCYEVVKRLPPNRTRANQNDSNDIHKPAGGISTNGARLDRDRVLSFITPTPTKIDKSPHGDLLGDLQSPGRSNGRRQTDRPDFPPSRVQPCRRCTSEFHFRIN